MRGDVAPSPRVICMFSGGAGSYLAAKRAIQQYGQDAVTLLFADTKSEDEETYDFLERAAGRLGLPLTVVADGRDIWDVADDEGYIPNNRVDICSRILKRQLLDRWRKANADPADTLVCIGYDWDEPHRLERFTAAIAPWRVIAPMTEAPHLTKTDMLLELAYDGLPVPRAYRNGQKHNNCGKYGCFKGGLDYWRLLYWTNREAFERSEAREARFNDRRVARGLEPVTILRYRSGPREGARLPLSELRQQEERRGEPIFDADHLPADADLGSCNCFAGPAVEALEAV